VAQVLDRLFRERGTLKLAAIELERVDAPLLRSHLAIRLEAELTQMLELLQLLDLPIDVARLLPRLRSPDKTERAAVLESFDLVLEGLKSRVMPFLDGASDVEFVRIAKAGSLERTAPEKRMAELARSDSDRWLALAAYHALVRTGGDRAGVAFPRAGENLEEETKVLELMDRAVFLKTVPLFAQLSTDAVFALAAVAKVEDVPAERVIVKEQELGSALYVLMSGAVDVLKEGGSHKLATLGPRDCFGEMAVLADEPRSATIRATLPSTLLSVAKDDFLETMEKNPSIAREVIRVLIQRLKKTGERASP
jgi:hypothetical protein